MKKILIIFVGVLLSLSSYSMPGGGGCTSPANELCGAATAIAVGACDGGGQFGCDVTGDPGGVSCGLAGTGSAWYSFVAPASGNVTITATLTAGCYTPMVLYSGACGAMTEIGCHYENASTVSVGNFTGLTGGVTYHINMNSNCTTTYSSLCVTDAGAGGGGGGGTFTGTPVCTNNQTCATAYNFDADMAEPATNTVMDGDTMSVCGTDCNTGASDEAITIAGSCPTTTIYQSTWYTFVADNDLMDITVTTDGSFTPIMGIWNGCGGIYGCWITGAGNTVSTSQFSLVAGNTYSICVGATANGAEGDFTICVDDYTPSQLCNNTPAGTIVATPPQTTSALIPGGTWPPGTTVDFCYTVNPYNNSVAGGCQWLKAIVPSFGGCFDPSTLASTAVPAEATGNGDGVWTWSTVPVTHNTLGSTVNPDGGWFFDLAGSSVVPGWGDGCPNNSWGMSMGSTVCADGCVTAAYSAYSWTACFSIQTWSTEALCNANSLDCSVEFRTYSDGEVGSYTSGYCANDLPNNSGTQIACCDAIDPKLVGVVDIDTSSFVGSTFTVTVDEPIVCANLAAGDFDLLTNGFPLGGTTITSVVGTGCLGATDTTSTLTFTLSAAPAAGYDHTWYVRASAAADITDVCGNPMLQGSSNSVMVLPVEMLTFSGEFNGSEVDLEWSTASEVNSAFYHVQSSTDGENFSTFLVRQAVGNSTTLSAYTGVDRFPTPGIMYYRLLILDTDGSYEYSETIAVEVRKNAATATVYPNPADNAVNVDIDYFGRTPAKIYIYNAVGEILREQDVYLIRGTNKKSINISSLPQGTYILKVVAGDTRLNEIFVKE